MSGSPAGDAALAFPGATGVTLLDVYDWVAPDGLRGGSAHIHLASTEGYLILRGAGRLQTLGAQGFREEPLRPGDCLWFTPGTVHRLVNEDGQLQILVIMQNAGLPEAGDCVLTFPPAILADPARYAAAASLAAPPRDSGDGSGGDRGTARRGTGWRPRPGDGGIWPSRGSPRCAPRWSGRAGRARAVPGRRGPAHRVPRPGLARPVAGPGGGRGRPDRWAAAGHPDVVHRRPAQRHGAAGRPPGRPAQLRDVRPPDHLRPGPAAGGRSPRACAG